MYKVKVTTRLSSFSTLWQGGPKRSAPLDIDHFTDFANSVLQGLKYVNKGLESKNEAPSF